MNEEQVKSIVGWFVATFGGAIAGFFAAKGWFSIDDVLSVLNSGTFVGIVTSLIIAVWRMFVHTQANAIAVADAIPDVKGVIIKSTESGKALAKSIPSLTVATAGTDSASVIASTSPSTHGGHP